MSDNNSNVFKFGTDVYTDKGVLEGAIAEVLSAHLATLGLSTVQCGEKTLAIRVDVSVLTGRGRPVGSKNAPKDGSAGPKLTGTHYVGADTDGTFAYIHTDDLKDNLPGCTKLYEFRTKDGAMYAIEHNTVQDRPCAWTAPVSSEVVAG